MPDRTHMLRDIHIFERGWLSSNNILITGKDSSALIDSGYCIHAEQTLALVDSVLQGRVLDVLVNTHLHSDHCGGNAALQARYPAVQTLIPPGHAAFVAKWDPQALSYTPTGQTCPQFTLSAVLQPGTELRLGDMQWQVHAAPGHDPHSVILFAPERRVLVSADALWERGFGVVFPELDGVRAFDEVADTLDLIERLQPLLVIPGHGSLFSDVAEALARARQRLEGFQNDPVRHLQHAAKVLLKFKLLERQSSRMADLLAWSDATPYFRSLFTQLFPGADSAEAVSALVQDLVRAGAASVKGEWVHNA
jgi:glyoxylase-like metal-dependent hydrolase (beta-lactamase superfamily II)